MNPVARLAGLVGVYEKSLPESNGDGWTRTFDLAAESGYDFFEMSIDETSERLARLDWTARERDAALAASRHAGVTIGTICLSAQRAHPMGSADPGRRAHSRDLVTKAIELAASLEAPLVQLAGYFTFYEPHHRDARQYFLEGLAGAAEVARHHGVRLAIENVDGRDVTTVSQAMSLIRDSSTAEVVGLYVDVGNNVGNGQDVVHELTEAWPVLDAIQLKDAKPGIFRRVQFGSGDVPWQHLFEFLAQQSYGGPLSVEMWNDEGDPDLARDALTWLREQGLAR